MYYFEDSTPQQTTESSEQQRLLLDGTVNLDYADDESPQASNWLTLLKQYLGSRSV